MAASTKIRRLLFLSFLRRGDTAMSFGRRQGSVTFLIDNAATASPASSDAWWAGPLDGCQWVYLDVGSNIGVQVRKLFEPSLYPGSDTLKYYDQHFGPPETRLSMTSLPFLCAVGWEPNPDHKKRLDEIELAYAQAGFRAHFFHAGVSTRNDNLTYFSEPGNNKLSVGGSLHSSLASRDGQNAIINHTVPIIDFDRFLRDIILARKLPDTADLPAGALPPAVVMKMDSEGEEYAIFSKTVDSGVLCKTVDRVLVEWHPPFNGHPPPVKSPVEFGPLLRETENCRTHFNNEDDEKYYQDGKPLPQSNK